jgi:putative ABC transport system ATP-binding protein
MATTRGPAVIRYVRRCRGRTLAGLWIVGLAMIGLELVVPAQVGRLTDLFLRSGEGPTWRQVHGAVGALLGAQLVIALMTFWQRKSLAEIEQSLLGSLVHDVFGRVLRFSADFYHENEVERINTRTLEDSRTIANSWACAVVVLPLAAISLVVFGGYMLWRNWFLGLCLIPLSFLSGYFLIFDRVIQRLSRQMHDRWDSVRVRSNEVIAGIAEIRNHAAFDYGHRSVETSFRGYTDLMARVGTWNAFFRAAGPVVTALQTSTLYWLGAGLCMAGSRLAGFAGALTWGDVVAFLLIAKLFRDPVQTIADFVLQGRLSRQSLRRIEEYLARPVEFDSLPGAPQIATARPQIAFRDVCVTTKTGATILQGVNAVIDPGKHVALVGFAGCGKSTAIQLIVRGATPSAGSLLLDGREIAEYDALSLAAHIGLVPQSPTLFDTTIRENILLGIRRAGRRTISDASGMLDVTRLDKVTTVAELDQALLEAVRRANLEQDVFHKGLDGLLPGGATFDALRSDLPGLRASVASALRRDRQAQWSAFDAAAYLVLGTLRENLLGPGIRGEEDASAEARRLFRAVEGTRVVELLVRLGYCQFLSDYTLAVRVAQRAPRLALLFRAAHDKSEPLDPWLGLPLDGLSAAPANCRQALFEIGLDTDAQTARDRLPGEDLEGAILAARQRLGNGTPGRGGDFYRWQAVMSCVYAEPLSLRENLLAGRVSPRLHGVTNRVDAILHEILQAAGLLERVLLAGLEFPVGENGKRLSGGQRQKVAIARVLLKDPVALLLDEATANLDEASQTRIVASIGEHFRERTVLSVSHRLQTILDFDEVLVVDRGRIVQHGPPARLAAQSGPFQELLSQQAPLAVSAAHGEPKEGAEPPTLPSGDMAWAPEAPPTELPTEDGPGAAIRRCELFASLDGDQAAALERVAEAVECSAGNLLFQRGDPGDSLFLICRGTVEFLAPRRGDAGDAIEVVDAYGPYHAFGELALFGDGVRTLGARAKTDVRLLRLTKPHLLALLDADPTIGAAFLKVLARRIAQLRLEQYGPLAA